jgi:hypothetical protein
MPSERVPYPFNHESTTPAQRGTVLHLRRVADTARHDLEAAASDAAVARECLADLLHAVRDLRLFDDVTRHAALVGAEARAFAVLYPNEEDHEASPARQKEGPA